MAGDWIKLEHATPDKPEVFRIADILGIDPDAVVGKLIRFWCWCDQQSRNGHALSVTETVIDRVTHQSGFAAALREVTWLDGKPGELTIPNFERHNGTTAKDRGLAVKRKKSQRERDICHGASVTEAGPEKRREEKSNTGAAAPIPVEPAEDVPLPNVLLTEAFKAKWSEYLQYRKTRRLAKLIPASVKAQLAKLAEYGHEGALESIDQTIRNQYQGLFPPKWNSGKPAPAVAAPVRKVQIIPAE